jgi:predicted RNA binding protein YcfA (HicA-like mRNA interferase family)
MKFGFYEVSQSGSHKKFFNGASTAIVPAGKREIPIGTFLSIVRQSGISRNEFDK